MSGVKCKPMEHKTDCEECGIVPVLPWYRDALREAGQAALAGQIEALAENGQLSAVDIARTLDDIKSQVGDPLRTRLGEFDCAAQEALTSEGGE